MATFEHLRMIDLIEKFRDEVDIIYNTKNISGFKKTSALLQSIYNFQITCKEDFGEVQEYFKNLYSSFNYAALICNEGIKKKSLDKDDGELLFECLQIMLKCCEVILAYLKKQ
jgi:hypothetical protein